MLCRAAICFSAVRMALPANLAFSAAAARRYISLFPLMLGLLPNDSPELGSQLAQLTDPTLLWTPYGLRCARLIIRMLWKMKDLLSFLIMHPPDLIDIDIWFLPPQPLAPGSHYSQPSAS